MKKLAIKGLVCVAIIVALCMFFSGTIRTISTAKVKLVTAKQGKLEEQVKLSGTLIFPETEEIALEDMVSDQTLTIKRVRVTVGRYVEAGDVLFEAEIAGYDSAMKTLEEEYETAQTTLMDLERKNSDVHLTRTQEAWVEAYDALAEAKRVLRKAQTELEVAAGLSGVALVDGVLPAEVTDEALLALQQAVSQAQDGESDAQASFNSANRLGINEDIVTYVTQSRAQSEKMAEVQEKITALAVLAARAQNVTAPHAGYIVEINVKAGDSYDGKTAAVIMSAEGSSGVLRADASDIERKIEVDTQVSMERSNGKTLTKSVTESGVDSEGKRYIDVELTNKDITNLGGASGLMSEATQMVASYRATSSTTLLPVSAVRGSGDSRYVYVVNESMNALGERTLTVSQQSVTVLAEVGATASIQEDLSRQRIAYMEDRAISDGSQVMTYAE